MGSNGDSVDVAAVFQDIGDLEKEFADVELDACMFRPFLISWQIADMRN